MVGQKAQPLVSNREQIMLKEYSFTNGIGMFLSLSAKSQNSTDLLVSRSMWPIRIDSEMLIERLLSTQHSLTS